MAGMNLLEMIMQAQGGKAAQNAGSQLGLNANQSQQAIAALLPAISSALKMNTKSPQGLAGLLGALQGGKHSQYIEQADIYAKPETVNDGNAILGHLFGSKDVSRAVAGHAAKKTGLGADVLKKMLPMVASMAMGSLSKQTQQQPSMASQLAGLALGGGQQQQAGGLGSLLGALTGGNARRQRGYEQQRQQGMGLIGKMLDADNDGSMMDDVLKMAMKNMMK